MPPLSNQWVSEAFCFAVLKPRKKITSLFFHGTELRNGATLPSYNVDRID
jgi:hypothetical protein